MSSHKNEWERFTMAPPNPEGELRGTHGQVSGPPTPGGNDAPPLRWVGQGGPRGLVDLYQDAGDRPRASSISGFAGIARGRVYPGAVGSEGRVAAGSGYTRRVGHVYQEYSQYGLPGFWPGGRERTIDPGRGFGSSFPVGYGYWGAVPDPRADPRLRPGAVRIRPESVFDTDYRAGVPVDHRVPRATSGFNQGSVYQGQYNSVENAYNEPLPHNHYLERSSAEYGEYQPRDRSSHHDGSLPPDRGPNPYLSSRLGQDNWGGVERDFDNGGDYWRPGSDRGRGWGRGRGWDRGRGWERGRGWDRGRGSDRGRGPQNSAGASSYTTGASNMTRRAPHRPRRSRSPSPVSLDREPRILDSHPQLCTPSREPRSRRSRSPMDSEGHRSHRSHSPRNPRDARSRRSRSPMDSRGHRSRRSHSPRNSRDPHSRRSCSPMDSRGNRSRRSHSPGNARDPRSRRSRSPMDSGGNRSRRSHSPRSPRDTRSRHSRSPMDSRGHRSRLSHPRRNPRDPLSRLSRSPVDSGGPRSRRSHSPRNSRDPRSRRSRSPMDSGGHRSRRSHSPRNPRDPRSRHSRSPMDSGGPRSRRYRSWDSSRDSLRLSPYSEDLSPGRTSGDDRQGGTALQSHDNKGPEGTTQAATTHDTCTNSQSEPQTVPELHQDDSETSFWTGWGEMDGSRPE